MHHGAGQGEHRQQHAAQQRQVAGVPARGIGRGSQREGGHHQKGAQRRMAHGHQRRQGRHKSRQEGKAGFPAFRAFLADGLKAFSLADQRDGQRQRHKAGQAQQEGGGFGDRHPVLPEEEKQVGRVDSGVIVLPHRVRVQPDEPGKPRLSVEKGQADRQRHKNRAQNAQKEILPPEILFLPSHVHEESHQPQGTRHQGLGLHQHGQHVDRQGKPPAAVDDEQHTQQQQQGGDAVRLPPGGAGQEGQGVEGVQRGQPGRGFPGHPLFCCAVKQPDDTQVTKDGRELDHRLRGSRAQQAPQPSKRPQDQHVAGRVIAEVPGGVEPPGADLRHPVRPGGEAADVHREAGGQDGDRQA